MVYLIAEEEKIKKNIILLLKQIKINFKEFDWNKMTPSHRGLFLIADKLPDPRKLQKMELLIKHNLQVILLCETENIVDEYDHNILLLPMSISMKVLGSLLNWILSRQAAELCFGIMRSFFYENQFQIFFIDKDSNILFAVPEDDSFLGTKGRYFESKSFTALFGLSLEDIPNVGDNELNSTYSLSSRGKKLRISLYKINYKEMNIPGAPENTQTIIFLNNLNTGEETHNPSKNKRTIHIEQRAIELLAANEIHHQQTMKLKNAFEQLNRRNKQIMEELSLASDLQKSLLPRSFPDDMFLNFTHKYLPHAYIGGDFFDIIRLDENKLGIIIADVSGHGVSAAFITAMFKSAFDHYSREFATPSELIITLNKEFSRTIHTEHYITAFYSILDMNNMTCTYCNAGHPKQLLFRKSGDIIELSSDGFFIGMFEDTEYKEEKIPLYPGDRLIYFTDGIIEITNEKQELFGRENVIRVIKENSDLSIETVSNALMSSLVMYMNDIAFTDDITILITEVIEDI